MCVCVCVWPYGLGFVTSAKYGENIRSGYDVTVFMTYFIILIMFNIYLLSNILSISSMKVKDKSSKRLYTYKSKSYTSTLKYFKDME